jgi:hypothetical protein
MTSNGLLTVLPVYSSIISILLVLEGRCITIGGRQSPLTLRCCASAPLERKIAIKGSVLNKYVLRTIRDRQAIKKPLFQGA